VQSNNFSRSVDYLNGWTNNLLMVNLRNMLFVVFCFVLVNTAKAQPSLETYVTDVSHFVSANYSKKDLSKIKSWSDSSSTENDKKKRVRHLWYGVKSYPMRART